MSKKQTIWSIESHSVLVEGRTYRDRDKAVAYIRKALKPIWDQPNIGQCGRTEGVEERGNTWVWGDGYIVKIRELKLR